MDIYGLSSTELNPAPLPLCSSHQQESSSLGLLWEPSRECWELSQPVQGTGGMKGGILSSVPVQCWLWVRDTAYRNQNLDVLGPPSAGHCTFMWTGWIPKSIPGLLARNHCSETWGSNLKGNGSRHCVDAPAKAKRISSQLKEKLT